MYIENSSLPPTRWVSVTPSDTEDLAVIPRAISCNVAGNVCCVDEIGNEAIIRIEAGYWRAMRPARIKASGTTATGIVAAW